MTDLLDRAIARTRDLPPDMQDEAARMLLLFAGGDEAPIQLTPEEEAESGGGGGGGGPGRVRHRRGGARHLRQVQAVRLRFTRRATGQLDRILTDLAARSPQGVTSVSERVSDVLTMLVQFPQTGRRTARRGVRRINIVPYPYQIDYRIDGREVVILGVRHASRRPVS